MAPAAVNDIFAAMRRAIRQAQRATSMTPYIVADTCAVSNTDRRALPRARRFELMRVGDLHIVRGDDGIDTEYVWDASHSTHSKVANYRQPNDVAVEDIERIDRKIADLQEQRGMYLADHFMDWPLLSITTVEKAELA